MTRIAFALLLVSSVSFAADDKILLPPESEILRLAESEEGEGLETRSLGSNEVAALMPYATNLKLEIEDLIQASGEFKSRQKQIESLLAGLKKIIAYPAVDRPEVLSFYTLRRTYRWAETILKESASGTGKESWLLSFLEAGLFTAIETYRADEEWLLATLRNEPMTRDDAGYGIALARHHLLYASFAKDLPVRRKLLRATVAHLMWDLYRDLRFRKSMAPIILGLHRLLSTLSPSDPASYDGVETSLERWIPRAEKVYRRQMRAWKAERGFYYRERRAVVSDLAYGPGYLCAVVDGKIRCWAESSSVESVSAPEFPIRAPRSLTLGDKYGCALSGTHQECWWTRGLRAGQRAKLYSRESISGISVFDHHGCRITERGVDCWGRSRERAHSVLPVLRRASASGVSAYSVSTHENYSCALGRKNGQSSAYCWGGAYDWLRIDEVAADGALPLSESCISSRDTRAVVTGPDTACAYGDGSACCWTMLYEHGNGRSDSRALNGFGKISGVAISGDDVCVAGDGRVECMSVNGLDQGLLQLRGVSHIVGAPIGRSFCAAASRGIECWGETVPRVPDDLRFRK